MSSLGSSRMLHVRKLLPHKRPMCMSLCQVPICASHPMSGASVPISTPCQTLLWMSPPYVRCTCAPPHLMSGALVMSLLDITHHVHIAVTCLCTVLFCIACQHLVTTQCHMSMCRLHTGYAGARSCDTGTSGLHWDLPWAGHPDSWYQPLWAKLPPGRWQSASFCTCTGHFSGSSWCCDQATLAGFL